MSPRPRKHRNCACPSGLCQDLMYKPAGIPAHRLPRVTLFHDEFEAIRLCDGEGLTQEEAGLRMGVSRGTVQRLVSSGRAKVARALTQKASLIVKSNSEEAP